MNVDLKKAMTGFNGEPLMNEISGVRASLEDGTDVYLKYGLKVKDQDGKEIMLIDDRKPTTIGDILLQLSATPLKGDESHTPEERMRLFDLSCMFHENKGKTVSLTASDVVELKNRALKLFLDPQIFTGVVDAIDPGSRKK
jgi:hypothetical protein